MLLALLLPLALVQDPSPEPPSGEPGTLVLERQELTLSDGSSTTIERGMLHARLVRSDPESAVIGIDVVRFPAQESAPAGTPPVFLLHGGPGWPGLGPELQQAGWHASRVAPFTLFADLVMVGQRGIGSSPPDTLCRPFTPPADAERTPAEEDAARVAACRACREHWEALGYDLRGFNVIEAAADVDDVRRLLGYERITLYGTSFGSHWGMAVMRFHPESVARAVLSGMEGPDHTYDMPSGVLASLERIAAEAEVAPELVEEMPDVGLLGALEEVIAAAAEEPIEVVVDHPVTGAETTVVLRADDIRGLALGVTSHTSSRSRVAGWPADLIHLYRGEFEDAARRRLEGDDRGLPTASFFMLDCGSGISPARAARLEADPAARIVGDLGHVYRTLCPAWGADLGDDFRAGFVTSIPTLIVQGTWDTNTPFDNALELLDSFENGHFVVVDGGSHEALDEALSFSDGFRAQVTEFLATGDLAGLPGEVRLPPIHWWTP